MEKGLAIITGADGGMGQVITAALKRRLSGDYGLPRSGKSSLPM